MKLFYLLLIIILIIPTLAKNSETQKRTYYAVKTNPNSPAIDGRVEDQVWGKAVRGDGFLQMDPVEGDPPSEKTYFKICYDDKNLYVLIHAYDSEPHKVVKRISRRDDVSDSDKVGIFLDSYYDRRTAFEFTVNAGSVKYDAVISNDNLDEDDESWDPVWDVATSVNDSGWVAEMRIPFSQLRFTDQKEHIWGMEVYRYIHRKQEITIWQLIPKNAPGFVSYFGHLKGIRNIQSPKRIEILPYAVSKLHTFEKEEDNPFASGRSASATGGVDGKIGLTGNLTADFTINPDFGQVEADPSEVNLTAFETFFEERRPFFIEGKNIFHLPLGIGDGYFSRETIFYSRRIGRKPQHEPDINDDYEYMKIPEQTSILGAVKLSGKTAGGWSIGVLDAVTAEEKAEIDSFGIRRQEVVEPFANYFVGRLQKDFHEGNTYLGGMFTATNRNINQSYLNYLNKSAYTGCMDFNHQWKDKTYFTETKISFSHVRGHKDALLEVQTASARYYQRPDANYVKLDSNRTSLSGHGGSFNIGRQGNGRWQYIFGGIWRSPGFELNDVGYLQEADRVLQYFWVGYRILNPIGIFNNIYINANQWNGWNFGWEKIYWGSNINGGGQFKNYWGFWLGINHDGKGLSSYALRGGPSLRVEGGWNSWVNFYSDSRKKIQFNLNGSGYWSNDNITRYRNLSVDLIYRPSNRLSISFEPMLQINRINLQYIDTFEKDGEDRYIFGRLEQKTLGIVFRFNYSITPDLTIQYYGQPFISSGQYSLLKRITHSRADKYEDRFHTFGENEISFNQEDGEYLIDEDLDGNVDYSFESPHFNFKQFRSNLVIRWEYRPGSQIYLVWSQERTGDDDYGNFLLRRDFKNLYNITPDNIFLIKFNHWFSL